MNTFYLRIDDDAHSLNKENGLSIEEVAKIFDKLSKAIDPKDGSKCVPFDISGNCYQIQFYSESEAWFERFQVVHKNIEIKTFQDLRENEAAYAKVLKNVLGNERYALALDETKTTVARLESLDIDKAVNHYFVTKNIVGYISEIGAKNFSGRSHIWIDGVDFKIYINPEQDTRLKPFYRDGRVRLKIREKRSLENARVISAELLDFQPPNTGSLLDRLQDRFGNTNISFLE